MQRPRIKDSFCSFQKKIATSVVEPKRQKCFPGGWLNPKDETLLT